MKRYTEATAEEVARRATEFIATTARRAVEARGLFSIALSGGSTPWKMLNRLASEDLPWHQFHVFQVDERVAPEGDPARNLTHIRTQFLDRTAIPDPNVYPMPVSGADLQAGAQSYGQALERVAGSPARLDLVHLGMGSDGHTASLVPGDEVLDQNDRNVAITGVYQGHQRMTLTFPAINRARQILWLVTGADKAAMVSRLLQGDPAIPAGRISQEQAVLITDIPQGELQFSAGG